LPDTFILFSQQFPKFSWLPIGVVLMLATQHPLKFSWLRPTSANFFLTLPNVPQHILNTSWRPLTFPLAFSTTLVN
jgi:hypothetical protein